MTITTPDRPYHYERGTGAAPAPKPTTCAIFLGHNGLAHGVFAAQADIGLLLRHYNVTVLSTGTTLGAWDSKEEPGTVWLITLPNPDAPHWFAAALRTLATAHGQDAIGFLVHDHSRFTNSYQEAI